MKVHILGGPGSGKTTLAQRIAERWNLPAYDLDRIYQKHPADPAAFFAESRLISQQPDWVTEGIYLLCTDPLLQEADWIVLLDISWVSAARRIVQRHVVKSIRGTNQYPGLDLLLKLLAYTRDYYRNRRPEAAGIIQTYFDEYGTKSAPAEPLSQARLAKYQALIIPPGSAFVQRYLEPYRERLLILKNAKDQQRFLSILDRA